MIRNIPGQSQNTILQLMKKKGLPFFESEIFPAFDVGDPDSIQ